MISGISALLALVFTIAAIWIEPFRWECGGTAIVCFLCSIITADAVLIRMWWTNK